MQEPMEIVNCKTVDLEVRHGRKWLSKGYLFGRSSARSPLVSILVLWMERRSL
jgi:hypothetical protein